MAVHRLYCRSSWMYSAPHFLASLSIREQRPRAPRDSNFLLIGRFPQDFPQPNSSKHQVPPIFTIYLHCGHGFALDVTSPQACWNVRWNAQRPWYPRSLHPNNEEEGGGTQRALDENSRRQSRCMPYYLFVHDELLMMIFSARKSLSESSGLPMNSRCTP